MAAAVAIIVKDGKVLLGHSASKDFRFNKWAFVGGGIEEGETPYEAAERETREEAGLKVKARPNSGFCANGDKEVCYVICDYLSGEPDPNHEFFSLDWFSLNDLPKDILTLNSQILGKIF